MAEDLGRLSKVDTVHRLIQAGDKVTILVPNGIGRNGIEWKPKTGQAVMMGKAGWVLNMGGRHGTPGIATVDNLVSVKKPRKARRQRSVVDE